MSIFKKHKAWLVVALILLVALSMGLGLSAMAATSAADAVTISVSDDKGGSKTFTSSDTYTTNEGATKVTISASATSGYTVTGGDQNINKGTAYSNIITVTNDTDNTDTVTFTINITWKDAAVAELSSLTITPNVGSALFSGKPTSNSLNYTVENNVTSVDIAATAETGSTIISGTGTWNLSVGKNTRDVVVSATGNSQRTYTIEIIRKDVATLSNNANLSSITVNGSSISGINDNTTSYTASNLPPSTNITVSANAKDSNTKVKIGSDPEKTGNSSAVVATAASGQNKTIYIYTTAADGSTKTYTITLSSSNNQNSDATLNSFSVNRGSLDYSFSSSRTYYTLKLTDSSSFTVSAYANNSRAQVAITESPSTPSSGSYSTSSNSQGFSAPNDGASKYIYIHVKAENGTTKRYDIYVTRGGSTNNTLLSNIVVRAGSTNYSLMPSFNQDTEQYFVCIPSNAGTVYITPTAKDSNSRITVDGSNVSSGSTSQGFSVGTSSSGTTIPIRVSATNSSSNYETYNVTVYRSSRSSDSNVEVDDMTVRGGSSSGSLNDIALDPTFANRTTSYTVNMGSNGKYISFRYKPSNSYSKAFIIYKDTAYRLDDGSYSSSFSVSPSSGTSEKVTVRVFSPDYSNSRDYVFTLSTRASSNDNYLKALEVMVDGSYATVSPAFNKNTTNYSVSVKGANSIVTVIPTASDSNSTITVDGTTVRSGSSAIISLGTTSKVVPIKVTANDGSSRTYNVTFTRGQSKKIVLRVGSTTYMVNGVSGKLLAAPFTSKDRTMVPIRLISEQLGATVDWNGKTKTITIKRNGKTLTMVVGKTSTGLDVPPVVKNGTTFVPIRYVSEQLGANVQWIESSKEVVITE